MKSLSTPEAVADSLAELAPRLPDIEALVQNDETSWTLTYEDDTAILVEWADAPSRLVLSSEIGKPLPGRQLEVLQAVLSYNLLWRENGGVKVGQGGMAGDLVLLYEWHAETGSHSELPVVLENFGTLSRWWGCRVTLPGDMDTLPPFGINEALLRA